jgi:hypothetical protein
VNIFDLLRQWKESQTIIELHYIHAGAKKIAHGRIYSFDLGQQNILFYNEDRKSVDNILLAQIEDAISASVPQHEVPRADSNSQPNAQKGADGSAAEVDTNQSLTKPGKKNLDLKEEIVLLIEELGTPDLYALYPMIKHLAKQQEKRTTSIK